MRSRESVGATLEMVSQGRTERVIELRGTDLHIGRHPMVGVPLDHPKVSLYHARIERRFDGTYRVVDLMSKNATHLDGVRLKPYEPTEVREGSRIRIVDYEFIFHEAAARVGAPGEVAKSTVLGSLADLSSSGLVQRAVDPAGALLGVIEVVRALGGASNLDERLSRALGGLMTILPKGTRGFVATLEPDGSLPLRAHRDARGPAGPPVLSRTLIEEVLRKGRAILIKDVYVDERFKDHESLSAAIRTAICAPLLGHDGRPVGMVQLDGVSPHEQFREEDLDLLAALAVPIATAVENDRLVREQASWAAAAEIQRALLPRARPAIPGYTFWEFYRTAQEVGGDLYDYIRVEDPDVPASVPSRWCVTLGDVTGHGMSSAILMAGVCPEVRLLARAGYTPEEILTDVNEHFYDSGISNHYVTMMLIEVDPAAHRLTVASAGHPAPLVRRVDGRVDLMDCPGGGSPIGVDRDATYRSAGVDLAPGEVVVLYSDGLVDAVDHRLRPFGLDRLKKVLAQTEGAADQVGEAILAVLSEHMKDQRPLDDLSIVCFGRAAEPS
ncbi:SpoIIE family protein phosphatase [Planctomyces sp. SH-PL62]|uniref:SpoIIE family protein phosphatase n=1 Tax=Planctomyces sp. SH-PL62 TaxID=1636152 RepID=UPI00078DECC0|nr:SpoIIE family protein phosphatase [Planctomyces sp. SH-PL62]AMV40394.1 Phosphoserine phosphatase RsbP [Planctomyces sp. SH-PL62]